MCPVIILRNKDKKRENFLRHLRVFHAESFAADYLSEDEFFRNHGINIEQTFTNGDSWINIENYAFDSDTESLIYFNEFDVPDNADGSDLTDFSYDFKEEISV